MSFRGVKTGHIGGYDEQILKICRDTPPAQRGCRLKSKPFRYLKEYILAATSFLEKYKVSLTSRAWFVLNKIDRPFVCETCGRELSVQNVDFDTGRHTRFCCPRCECVNADVQRKARLTNVEKYGCEWSFQSDNNKNKSKQTMRMRYGVDYAQQNEKIRSKSRRTMKDLYGHEYSMQCKGIRQKSISSARSSEYQKFLKNKFVKPEFSAEDYMRHGCEYPYEWTCLKCGCRFVQAKNDSWLKQGPNKAPVRCEKCYPYDVSSSAHEKYIADFIRGLGFEIVYKQRQNIQIIKPYEIDIYVPAKKLAIEYDGLYWHSINGKANAEYHLNKTEMCESNSIQLIHVFENEMMSKKNIVEDRIKSLLGVYDNVVFARKCRIREITQAESNAFQDQNHMQGHADSFVNIGLFYEGRLVSVMAFSKCRFDRKYEWELLRFCCKLGYRVHGAAGKLLKYFERNYKPRSIVSRADRRWSAGKLYYSIGFQLSHVSKPTYWYWKSPRRIEPRVKFRKRVLAKILPKFDPEKSESQNMADNGYYRIFDCGNMVFEKFLK